MRDIRRPTFTISETRFCVALNTPETWMTFQRPSEISNPHLPSCLFNLGNSFSCRFGRTGNLDGVSEATQNQQCAVQLTPEGHPQLPFCLCSLGTLIWRRFARTGDLDDISESIRNQQYAAQMTPDGHPHCPPSMGQMGITMSPVAFFVHPPKGS